MTSRCLSSGYHSPSPSTRSRRRAAGARFVRGGRHGRRARFLLAALLTVSLATACGQEARRSYPPHQPPTRGSSRRSWSTGRWLYAARGTTPRSRATTTRRAWRGRGKWSSCGTGWLWPTPRARNARGSRSMTWLTARGIPTGRSSRRCPTDADAGCRTRPATRQPGGRLRNTPGSSGSTDCCACNSAKGDRDQAWFLARLKERAA